MASLLLLYVAPFVFYSLIMLVTFLHFSSSNRIYSCWNYSYLVSSLY